ncbi:MAG: phosphatase PAP2 family protein [Rhodothermales bacterium]|nr:phosphatase PAP2 family protein [Rhodothermales bacterium]
MTHHTLLAVVVVLVGLTPAAAPAQAPTPPPTSTSTDDSPLRFARWVVGDVLAPFRQARDHHALAALGVGGGIALFTLGDAELTEEAAEQYGGPAAPVFDLTSELGGRPGLIGAAALFGGSLFTDDTRFQDAAFTSLEAGLYASFVTNMLKGAFGRVRPLDGGDPFDFEPFSGHYSFPSGHTTLAFGLVVPWVVYYPGPVTYGLGAVAVGTAAARVALQKHWPTDVLAGAFIGSATGYLLARRHLRLSPSAGGASPTVTAAPLLVPSGAGLRLALTF